MSERKVLNKYYPADFDPNNIPKMRRGKSSTFNIRLMAPCNMRCNTCGVYIYKGKKFNSRKEDVEGETFLGLRIFRFYIKCPSCVSEIAFKTDLKNTDYVLEAGATRLFEAEKLAKEMAERERQEKEEEELNNPMKVLENRTIASKNEIETIDALEELRDINSKKAQLDHNQVIEMHLEYEKQLQKLQEEEEEKEIRAIFGEKEGQSVKRLVDDSGSDDDQPKTKKLASEKPTDILSQTTTTTTTQQKSEKKPASWEISVGGFSGKNSLKGLVVKKKQQKTNDEPLKAENQSDTKLTNGNSEVKTTEETSSPSLQKTNETKNLNSEKSSGVPNATSGGVQNVTSSKPIGLGLLGNYSDSDSGQD